MAAGTEAGRSRRRRGLIQSDPLLIRIAEELSLASGRSGRARLVVFAALVVVVRPVVVVLGAHDLEVPIEPDLCLGAVRPTYLDLVGRASLARLGLRDRSPT